ncbi:MAG: AzlC family ABC transporter permease [Actinomycetota bacterium]
MPPSPRAAPTVSFHRHAAAPSSTTDRLRDSCLDGRAPYRRGPSTQRTGTSGDDGGRRARLVAVLPSIPAGSQLTRGELFALGLTYFSVGVAAAVVLVNGGTDRWVVVLSAFVINAVTTQFAYVAALDAGGSSFAAVLSGWLVATRFGLLAAAIGPRLWPAGWRRLVAAYTVFDPNTAVAVREPDDERCRSVFALASLSMTLPWFAGTAIGAVLADRLGDPSRIGLDAVLPAVLLAIIWPQLRTSTGRLVAATAAALALGLVEPTPGGVPAIAAVAAAAWALRAGDDR